MQTPGILLIIGGVLVLLGGIGILLLGSSAAFAGYQPWAGYIGVFGIVHLLFGVVLIASGAHHHKRPWATVGLVFSILSFFSLGGAIIGAVIALVGAALALYHPTHVLRTTDK